MFSDKNTLLLDMNSTFMFGEDRFSESEDYSIYYRRLDGQLSNDAVNTLINDVLGYLGERYPQEAYRHNFPTIEEALAVVSQEQLPDNEIQNIVNTFAFHEHGHIPEPYVEALQQLYSKYTLAVVIDIWAPKALWLETFERLGLNALFSASSFSSDHGMVKPSPKPFERVITELNVPRENCLVIGDSVRRDLGGAMSAGIDCVLVNGASDNRALASYPDLLAFRDVVMNDV